MKTAQREARAFLKQFHHRPFTVSDLVQALQAQGFSLVTYSRLSNCKEVTTLLSSLRLFDYAAGQSAFTYQDPNLRIVFMLENLSQEEQMILLSHELGHILCRHLDQTVITGPGTGVMQEQEANEFAARLMRYNKACRPRRMAVGAAAVLLIGTGAGVLLFSSSGGAGENATLYLAASVRCSQRKSHRFVGGRDNPTPLPRQQAEKAGYEPCAWCFGFGEKEAHT